MPKCQWLLKLFLGLILCFLSFKQYAFDIEEATIDSVHQAFRKGELTCSALVNAYIERIQKYNLSLGVNPPINAITQINPYVLSQAANLDKMVQKNKRMIGPLHCIPVILKDNIDTFDTLTTAGSYSLLGNQPIKDANLVASLRRAGAIILAKAAQDEFSWGLYGISSRSGRVGNVYDPSKNPGGSSSGVGASISANFAIIGIGTDNSGSIRIPAVFNGLKGLRPSTSLISQQGIFPMGNLDAVSGPITRTIKDLALTLEVITQKSGTKSFSSYLKEEGLNHKRIGIIRTVAGKSPYQGMPPDIEKVIDQAIHTTTFLGATFVDNINLKEFDINRENNQAGEIEEVNDYFKSYPGTRKYFKDICTSERTRTFGNKEECLKFMDELPSKDSFEYQAVLELFQKNRQYLEKIMNEQHLDALLMPISRGRTGSYDPTLMNTFILPVASNAGLPSIALTVGYSAFDNMPVGIELIGPYHSEGNLIAMSYAFEQKAETRRIPKLGQANTKLKKLSIAELNNFFTVLGVASFNEVLKNENPLQLTGQRFREIFIKKLKEENGGQRGN